MDHKHILQEAEDKEEGKKFNIFVSLPQEKDIKKIKIIDELAQTARNQ